MSAAMDQTGTALVPSASAPPSDTEATNGHFSREDTDPRLLAPVRFVRFHPDGTVHGWGTMSLGAIQIERIQTGAILPAPDLDWGPGILPAFDLGATHYVDRAAGAVREKAPSPVTREGLTLRGLPVPSKIAIAIPPEMPTVYAWDAPVLDLEFEHPGTYAVTVRAPAYCEAVFTVTADG